MTPVGGWAAAALATAVVLFGAAGARADAIEGPPTDCPAGSVGESSHSGAWCGATTCTADSDCEQYGRWPEPRRHYVCRQTELCVRTETYTLSQRLALPPGQAPPTATRAIGVGECGSACAAPAACTNLKRCGEQGAIAALARHATGGCGSCALVGRRREEREHERVAGTAIGVLFVLMAVGVARATRRPRR